MHDQGNFLQRIRWLPCRNMDAYLEIPPYAAIRCTGVYADGTLKVMEPLVDQGIAGIFFNGPLAIPLEGYGFCTRDTPCIAYAPGVPAMRQCGISAFPRGDPPNPEFSYFPLTEEATGFYSWGPLEDDDYAIIVRAHGRNITDTVSTDSLALLTHELAEHWSMDGASGSNETGLHRGLVRTTLQQHGTVGSASGVGGNPCRTFGGSDYFTVPGSVFSIDGAINFMLSTWVYFTSTTSGQTVLYRGAAAGGAQVQLYLTTSGGDPAIALDVVTDGGTTQVIAGPPTPGILANTWYHVLAWRDMDKEELGIYIAGSYLDTTTLSRTAEIVTGAPMLFIGTDTGSGAMTGRIDETSLWVGRSKTPLVPSNLFAAPVPYSSYASLYFS